MKKIITVIPVFTCLFILSSCQKTKEPGNTEAVKMANEWWVTLDQNGISDAYHLGHFKLVTYNTSENNNLLWIDDLGSVIGVKTKVTADLTNLTFSSAQSPNEYYDPSDPNTFPEKITTTDGKVLVMLGHSKTGNIVDSIHFKIELSSDPGNVYEVNGVSRSRFAEDDY